MLLDCGRCLTVKSENGISRVYEQLESVTEDCRMRNILISEI